MLHKFSPYRFLCHQVSNKVTRKMLLYLGNGWSRVHMEGGFDEIRLM